MPTAASNVVINQTRFLDCQVGLTGTTPLTHNARHCKMNSNSATAPQLTINIGRQLVVTGAATINRSAAGLNMGITVGNGSFTAR
ncbi:MAG: hypothetical protein IPN38_08730 [Flavobacteriales bacterium]|nr:hypothetical protein [Flavobacteriales bacterium]